MIALKVGLGRIAFAALRVVGEVVAAEVDGLSLGGQQLPHDLRLVLLERPGPPA